MIQEEVIRHATFWEQDVCVKCGRIVGEAEEPEVLLAACPLCDEDGRCSAQALATLLSLIDRDSGEDE